MENTNKTSTTTNTTKRYHVYGIIYFIDEEDAGLDLEDFALYSDYFKAVENKIDEIEDGLPSELDIDIGEDENIIDDGAEKISDATGYLVGSFKYRECN